MAVWLFFGVALASLCAGLVAVALWLWINRLQTAAPGPPTVPLLGNIMLFYKQPVLLDRFAEPHKQYGDVFRFYIGPKLFIVVTQPEDVKRVLLSSKPQIRDPYFAHAFRKIVGDGLLTNGGEIWEKHRKLLEPAFHFSELERYLDTFNEEGRLLAEKLAATGGAEVDVYSRIGVCTLRSAAFALTGLDFSRLVPDSRKQEELVTYICKGLKALSVSIFRPWKAVQGLMWMSVEGRELKRLVEVCENLFKRCVVLLKEEAYNDKNPQKEFLATFFSQENAHVLATDEEIRDEVVTLALAGSETTAGAMCYTLTLLGLHPEWQEKVWRELEEVFGSGDDFLRPVTKDDIAQLTVIDAIIKETLRLFPTVPMVPRLIAEDIPLAGGRYVAPAGCCVFLALSLMQRHPELFPDPYKFDPGRFLPGGSATSRKSFSYLPFTAGPRRCLGGHFATLEMKILLATVLRRFRIIPGSSRDELEDTLVSITGHPLTGYRVSCIPREMTTCTSLVNGVYCKEKVNDFSKLITVDYKKLR